MNSEEIIPLDLKDPNEIAGIIESNLPKDLKVIKKERDQYAIHIILNTNGRIIIHFTKDKIPSIRLSDAKYDKERLIQHLSACLNFDDNLKGNKTLPKTWRLASKKLSNELASRILAELPDKTKFAGATDDIEFNISIKGKSQLTHMKNGELTLMGRSNKITDRIFQTVELFLEENKKENQIKIKAVKKKKKSYEEFLKSNYGKEFVNKISKETYSLLSGRDVEEIEDGVSLFEQIEKEKVRLNNYKILVRSFAISFEGFLINFFLETGDINREDYVQYTKTARIGNLLHQKLPKHQEIEIRHRGLIQQSQYLWEACRNNYFHSDVYAYSELQTEDKAKQKISEIIDCMNKLTDSLNHILERKGRLSNQQRD